METESLHHLVRNLATYIKNWEFSSHIREREELMAKSIKHGKRSYGRRASERELHHDNHALGCIPISAPHSRVGELYAWKSITYLDRTKKERNPLIAPPDARYVIKSGTTNETATKPDSLFRTTTGRQGYMTSCPEEVPDIVRIYMTVTMSLFPDFNLQIVLKQTSQSIIFFNKPRSPSYQFRHGLPGHIRRFHDRRSVQVDRFQKERGERIRNPFIVDLLTGNIV